MKYVKKINLFIMFIIVMFIGISSCLAAEPNPCEEELICEYKGIGTWLSESGNPKDVQYTLKYNLYINKQGKKYFRFSKSNLLSYARPVATSSYVRQRASGKLKTRTKKLYMYNYASYLEEEICAPYALSSAKADNLKDKKIAITIFDPCAVGNYYRNLKEYNNSLFGTATEGRLKVYLLDALPPDNIYDKAGISQPIYFHLTNSITKEECMTLTPELPEYEEDIICPFCTETAEAWYFIGMLLFIIKILIPVIIIIIGSIDFAKAVTSSNDDALTNSGKSFIQRIILGILLFFVPTLLNVALSFVDSIADISDELEICTDCLLSPTSEKCIEVRAGHESCSIE